MKILVAIESSENPKTLAATTLQWAPRAGFNMRIFIPDKSQLEEYFDAIDHANYLWYTDLPKAVIETGDPMEFAKKEGYDLLVRLPEDLRKWDRKATHALNPYVYAQQVGEARLEFGKNPDLQKHEWENGAVIERVR